MLSIGRVTIRVLAVLLLLAFGAAAAVWWMRPPLGSDRVRDVVVSTVQREAPAATLTTGRLDVNTFVTIQRPLMQPLPGWSIGHVSARVRIPGRVSYGFDVAALRRNMIDIGADGVVQVVLPELKVVAVEADLARAEIETSSGWTRWGLGSDAAREAAIRREALSRAQAQLRKQAEAHLESSVQPRVNTARALEQMLRPPLQAAGLREPRFRFEVAPSLVLGEEAPVSR